MTAMNVEVKHASMVEQASACNGDFSPRRPAVENATRRLKPPLQAEACATESL